MTQYLRDITSLEALDLEREAIGKMRDLNITCNLDVIACDLHPGYMTSQIAQVISQETGSPLRKTLHRHTHIASVVIEYLILPDEQIISIALDGARYGTDGAIWGRKALIMTYLGFERAGQIQ